MITPLGIGTWTLTPTGGLWPSNPVTPRVASDIFDYVSKSSTVTMIDSAVAYGNGLADTLLSENFFKFHLDKNRKCLNICTKIGRSVENIKDLITTEAQFIASVTNSLRLRVFNVLAIHDADLFEVSLTRKMAAYLSALKEEGEIRQWGLSLSRPVILEELSEKPDFIQCNFNILDQRLFESGLYEWCNVNNIAIWARTIFLNGSLMGDTPLKRFHGKNNNLEEEFKKLRTELANIFPLSMSTIALRYVISFPNVNPLVGITSKEMLIQNIESVEMGAFSQNELGVLNEISSFYTARLFTS